MGGAVSITAPKSSEKTLFMKNLVHDTESIKSLFMDISNYGKSNGIKCTKSNLVCLAVVLLYIENEVNPQLSQHYKGMLTVIKEAFYYVVGYKKDVRLELTSKKFHRFMDALFMFSHLYKMFAAADDNIDDDSIFVEEFMRAKEKIEKIEGVSFTKEISIDQWMKEFHKIDSGANDDSEGWISFREFANYCCRTIITPEAYSREVRKRTQVGAAATCHITAVIPTADMMTSSETATDENIGATSLKPKNKPEMKVTSLKPKSKPETKETSHHTSYSQKLKTKDATYVQKFKKITRKKQLKKKATKKFISPPTKLSNEPLKIPTIITTPGTDPSANSEHPQAEIDRVIMNDEMDECSSPIEMNLKKCKVSFIDKIVDVIALEKKEEEDSRKAREEYVRPLYRPRSAAEIIVDVAEYKAWVDNTVAQETTCKSWVASDSAEDCFCDEVQEPIPGFGISGVNMVTFTYDMDDTNAESEAHTKYIRRKKNSRRMIWEPKYKKQIQRSNSAESKQFK